MANQFLHRYAKAERFELSRLVTHTGEFDAISYGPSCIQSPAFLQDQLNKTVSEDCLFLNVYAPRYTFPRSKLLPVVLYIHGGAFILGSGAPSFVNPHMYTRHGVILVSINYRLDLLGFLAHPSLPFTNFGLLDQRVAMEWIAANIEGFGGDPKQVTAIGDSAGAISILHHMTSPLQLKTPLFHRAVLLSAGLFAGPDLTLLNAQKHHLKLARERLACPGTPEQVLACLKSLPAASVRVSYTRMVTPFISTLPMSLRLTGSPVSDNTYFPDLIESLQTGAYDVNMPVVIGSDLDEGSLFAAMAFPIIPPTEEYLSRIVTDIFGKENGAKIWARYSPVQTGSVRRSLHEIAGHLFTSHGTCQIARLLAKSSKAPIFRFGNYHLFEHAVNKDLGVFHTSAHALLLRPNVPSMPFFPNQYTEDEVKLSDDFAGLLMQFIKTPKPVTPPNGQPSSTFELLPPKKWPRFTLDTLAELHIGVNSSGKLAPGKGFQADDCEFWNSLYPPHGLLPPAFYGNLYQHEPLLAWIVNETFWFVATYLRLFKALGLLILVTIGLAILYRFRPVRKTSIPRGAAPKKVKSD